MSTTANISVGSARETLGGAATGMAGVLFVVGLVGLGLGGAGAMLGHAESFWRAYVTCLAFYTTIGLGALFFVLMQHLTRAGWSATVRRVAELFTTAFPLIALLTLPVVVAMWMTNSGEGVLQHLYPWINNEHVRSDPVLTHKQPYLNLTFFSIRIVIYLLVWNGVSAFFRGTSLEQDRTGDERLSLRMIGWSPISMLLFALTLTFWAFDLLMSLEPHWFSTIFGVYVFAGSVVSFHATMILSLFLLQARGRLSNRISVEHYHDVGKLMFGFMVFWTYIAFSQYMLIWGANLPEETFWYKSREDANGPWLILSLILLIGHFGAPFLLLISRFAKRRPPLLTLMAIWMLVMHFADMVYLVFPRMPHGSTTPAGFETWDGLMLLACVVGMGGVCVSAVLRSMTTTSLVPVHDPRLEESMAFENV